MKISEMIKRMATPKEKVLFYTAFATALLVGIAAPAFSFVFGSMIDSAG